MERLGITERLKRFQRLLEDKHGFTICPYRCHYVNDTNVICYKTSRNINLNIDSLIDLNPVTIECVIYVSDNEINMSAEFILHYNLHKEFTTKLGLFNYLFKITNITEVIQKLLDMAFLVLTSEI